MPQLILYAKKYLSTHTQLPANKYKHPSINTFQILKKTKNSSVEALIAPISLGWKVIVAFLDKRLQMPRKGPSQLQSVDGPVKKAPAVHSKATILVVDDEPAVVRVLMTRLQLAGYRVISAEDGEKAIEVFHNESPDLVVLDVMLPKLDGFAVCRRLRAESCVPIIFLTALEAISERVAGLDLGADDYLSKPFSPKELETRIATILRRMGPGVAVAEPRELPVGQGVLRLGDLVVDTNRRQVSRAGERIGLTYTEFSLLELLFREPGRVVPRAEILEQLWGYPPRRAADLRVVDVYVARLRGKLEPDPRNPELILTVRGIGYASQRMGEFPSAIAS